MWYWFFAYLLLGTLVAPLAWMSRRLALRKVARESLLQDTRAVWPSVSIVKPVWGLNSETERALKSWLDQDYDGALEIVFSFQDAEDPALPLVKNLNSRREIKILVNEIRDGFSGKGSNLYYGVAAASSEFLILSDADMVASPDAAQEIVARSERGRSLVSCLPLHVESKNPWGQLYADIWNSVLVGFWGPSLVMNRAPGVAGGTVGFFKDDLISVGGVEAFASYVAEDLKMGALFRAKGFQFVLGPVLKSPVDALSFRQFRDAVKRGAFVSWTAERSGVVKSFALHAFIFGYAPILIYGALLDSRLIGPAAAILLTRMALISWFSFLSDKKLRVPLFTFFSDLLTLTLFLQSIFDRRLKWSGVRYRIARDGKMSRYFPPQKSGSR